MCTKSIFGDSALGELYTRECLDLVGKKTVRTGSVFSTTVRQTCSLPRNPRIHSQDDSDLRGDVNVTIQGLCNRKILGDSCRSLALSSLTSVRAEQSDPALA